MLVKAIHKLLILSIISYTPLFGQSSIKYERNDKLSFDFNYTNSSSYYLRTGELVVDNIQQLLTNSYQPGDLTSQYNFNYQKYKMSLSGTYLLSKKLNLYLDLNYEMRDLQQSQTLRYILYEFGSQNLQAKRDINLKDESQNLFNDLQLGASYFFLDSIYYVIADTKLSIPFGFEDGQFKNITNTFLGDGAINWYNGFRLGRMSKQNYSFLKIGYNYRAEDFRDHLVLGLGFENYKVEDVILFASATYYYTVNGFIDGFDLAPNKNNIQEDIINIHLGLQMNFDNINAQIAYDLVPYGQNTLNQTTISFRLEYLLK